MHTGNVDLRLPNLREDPFSQGPLSARDSNLLVGRHSHFEEMMKNIQFKSSRRILLVGEYGSGKTSFVNCLGGQTNLHIHVDRIDTINPGLELLRDIYAQVVNAIAPNDHKKLERELEASLHGKRNHLPIISVDADMAKIPYLETCLLASMPFFERLPALIVVAINPHQKSLLSEQIRERFEVRMMEELDIDSVKALVERRIGKYSNEPYQMTTQEAERVLAASKNGHPGSIIKVLRSVIDGQTLPATTSSLMTEHDAKSEFPSDASDETEASISHPEEEKGMQEYISSEFSEQEEDEVHEAIDVWEDGPSGTMAFDLNLESLEEPINEENKEEPIEETYVTEDSLPPVGVFGGLRGRWKQTSQSKNMEEEPEGEYKQMDGANSLWVSKDSLEAMDEEIEEISDDEDGDYEPTMITSDSFDSEYKQALEESTRQSNESTLSLLTNLLSQLLSPSGNPAVSNKLAEQLQALSRPKIGEKAEYVLNVHVLTSLTHSETIVVSVAQQRNISPSDKQLLEKLKIKRSRLSQICNKLHKAGILDVRVVGRSRMFGLTRTALAQMMAWGLVGGDI